MKVKINRVPKEVLDAPAAAPAKPNPADIGSIVFRDNSDVPDAGDEDLTNQGVEEEIFHPLILTRADGTMVRIFIKELDFFSLLDVEAGRLLVQGREVQRAPGREAKMGVALEMVATVYKRVKAGEEPEYAPYFADTDEAQLWMKQRKNKTLIGTVMAGIYTANQELHPKKKALAARSQNSASG
jgi:hypothetical protein